MLRLASVLFLSSLLPGVVFAKDLKVIVLHNNDMHARFEETTEGSSPCKGNDLGTNRCLGGFARTNYLIKKFRKEAQEGTGPPVLYLNAGDTYTGSAWFVAHKSDIVIGFLNLLRPDAASLGNHEFDLKVDGLIPYLNLTEFPILAANVHDDRLVRLEKSTILDVRGYKIGIVGYLTPQTVDISGAPDVNMTDEIPAINEECLKMRANNIKTVIAVGHSGYEMDQQIGRECECVDMVVGGHTNTFLWNGPAPSYEKPEGPYPTVVRSNWGKRVPVVQAYAYTKYLGKLEVTVDTDSGRITSWGGEPIFVNHAVPQDEETLEFLKPWKAKVDEMDVRVIGRSKVYLDGIDTSCRRRECNFGNLITDAFVDYRARLYRGHFWTDIPIAIINGGAIRMSIDGRSRDGNITLADLTGALPFNNDLYAVTLTGRELLQMLEFSVHSDGNTSLGEFLQMSGLEVVYDRSNPSGRRVVSAKARCGTCSIPKYEPVEKLKEYRILLPNFIGNGGDGYKVLRAAKKTVIGINEADGLISFFKAHRIIYPAVEERISFVTPQMKLGGGRSSGVSQQSNVVTVCLIGITYLARIFVT